MSTRKAKRTGDIITYFRLPRVVDKELKQIAKRHGITKASAVREIIRHYIVNKGAIVNSLATQSFSENVLF